MVLSRDVRILAAVLYCQNSDVRQMQKLVDREVASEVCAGRAVHRGGTQHADQPRAFGAL